MRFGLLAGSVIPNSLEIREGPLRTEHGLTSSGVLELSLGDNSFLMMARHGSPPSVPPHRVNHRANLIALRDLGVEAMVSICSTGALNAGSRVPSIAIPEDYIDLVSGVTFHDDEIAHVTPLLDPNMRKALMISCGKAGIEAVDGGIYIQTRGPRLETKAEVRLFSGWGDYVGMNMAPEATLSNELGIPFGAVLTVDNYAHGTVDEELDFRDILRDAKMNWEDILSILEHLPSEI